MTEKIGVQPYLGIHINYDKEEYLNNFTKQTIIDRYLWEGETHAQQAFARASIFGATYKGCTDFHLGQRLYEYASNHWFSFSTPILSNGGTSRGLPISCFLNYVPDSRDGLSAHYDENILRVEVEASVDIGVLLGAMVWILLTGAAVLDQYPLCML